MNQRGVWQLILMAREGDRQAIDELFFSSFRPAYLILYAITADKRSSLDILAEGYVEVFQNLESMETGSAFAETLNRFVINRAKALFPSKDFLRLPDGCEADAPAFRRNPPQIHDFDTLPALKLSARADEILSAFHTLPLEQQVCAYLYYYVQMQPDMIADVLGAQENRVFGTLQQARQAVLPEIESVLKKSAAFRGTDAESAIPWALRCAEQFTPSATETDECRQTVLNKLIADEILDVETQEEPEPEQEFQMQDIAPPKEHHLLHAIFSLRTLIIVLIVLVTIGFIVGMAVLHKYNQEHNNQETLPLRTTMHLTSTTFPSERNIFQTEYAAPTEQETTEPEALTEEPVATTEPATETPTVTEPTTPVITTAPPYADFEIADSGSTLTITGYSGSKLKVEVPDKINGKPVTAIGDNAFLNTNITSIQLPASIRSIGKNAFRSCTSLQSITIPDAVTTIQSNAFSECTKLEKVTLRSTSALSTLGSQAFSQCLGLTTITLPSSLTSIGDSAFASCIRLTSITIPGSVKAVGKSVFSECTALTSCAIDRTSRLTALGDSMFVNCVSLKSFTFPSTVKAVPANCFMGSHIQSVAIPDAVTTIGKNAFENCALLTTVRFGSKSALKTIESGAFGSCTSLREFTIPTGTTSIGSSAFNGCSNLQKITIPDTVKTIGSDVFDGCIDLVISCPAGSEAEKYAVKHHIEVEGRSDSTYNTDSSSE